VSCSHVGGPSMPRRQCLAQCLSGGRLQGGRAEPHPRHRRRVALARIASLRAVVASSLTKGAAPSSAGLAAGFYLSSCALGSRRARADHRPVGMGVQARSARAEHSCTALCRDSCVYHVVSAASGRSGTYPSGRRSQVPGASPVSDRAVPRVRSVTSCKRECSICSSGTGRTG
jgi:hypothetical protein